jgi:pyruvate dehydrogenase E1 component alpha subunit
LSSESQNILQVILSDGQPEESLDPKLSETELKRIYRAMTLTRAFDIKSLSLQRQGRIGFYAPAAGQEAAQIGSTCALREDDWVLPTYRDAGVAIFRGVPIPLLYAHLLGNSADIMKGRQMPNHWGYRETNFVSIAATIAAHLPVATGIAMGMKYRKEDKVVMALHGDGATSEGDFHSAYNFAGVFKAPVVFICENNGWAISLPSSKQTASHSFAEKAEAYGFGGVRVDGNDVLAVYKASKEAVDRARKGKGPSMVECITYRMGPHSTSDDPNRYRTKEEIEEWKRKDPIERFRSYLENRGIWTKDFGETVSKENDSLIVNSIKEEERVPRPEIRTMFEDVYAEMPWNLKEQMAYEEEEQRGYS